MPNLADYCQAIKQQSAMLRWQSGGMEKSNLDIFIDNVNRLIEHHGMTKIDLGRLASKHCDYSPRTITSALNREFKSPAFAVCEGIARGLNLPMYLLLIPDVRLELLQSKDLQSIFGSINQVSQPAVHYMAEIVERERRR